MTTGVESECGVLEAVLVHRPDRELAFAGEPEQVLWKALPDRAKAQEQHDCLAELYRSHGVAVSYLHPNGDLYPNLCFVRDAFAATPGGAILGRPAMPVRAGEADVVAGTLNSLGVPVCWRIGGTAHFEGADLMIVSRALAFVAVGSRSDEQGAAQVKCAVERQGIEEVILCRLPPRCMHLDCAVGIVDRHLAAVCPDRVPPECMEGLRRHGFRIVALPEGPETDEGMAVNLIALEPGLVVMAANNPRSKRALGAAGAECLEVDISELLKGRGGVHCLTAPLRRREI